jgi:nucleotide-binding universal stress UspA family protein
LIAGLRSLPTTVLSVSGGKKSDQKEVAATTSELPAADCTKSSDIVIAVARGMSHPQTGGAPLSPADITVRTLEKLSQESVASEAKKGYGLLIVGIANTRAKSGEFHPELTRVVSAFEGAVAIVAGRERALANPQRRPLNILVPESGTETSRRAAEFAIALARACECVVTALYVAHTGAAARRGFYGHQQGRAIINEVAQMGELYGVKVKTAIRADVAPDQAILSQAKQTHHDLLVMGVGRRPGEKLFFGDTAAAVFAHAPHSVLFLVS